jgi:hypothetical protein
LGATPTKMRRLINLAIVACVVASRLAASFCEIDPPSAFSRAFLTKGSSSCLSK